MATTDRCHCCNATNCGKRKQAYTKKHSPTRMGMPVAWGWNPDQGAFNGGTHPALRFGCPRPLWMSN